MRAASLLLFTSLGMVGLAACQSSGGGAGSGGATSSGGVTSGGATGSGSAGSTGGASSTGGATGGGGDPGSGGEAGGGAAPQTGGTSSSGGAGTGGAPGSGGESTGSLDAFGVTQLYPSAAGNAHWSSEHWSIGYAYPIPFGEDELDPSGLSAMRGDGELEVTGDGQLIMAGPQPRLYVYPDETRPWQNLEVTVYYQRVSDDDVAYAGLVVGVRSGPDGHNTDTACDAHTYYARLRNDGDIDFEKELKHPASSTGTSVDADEVWPPDGYFPAGPWVGWKFVIYNLDSSGVKLESYRDLTEGADGGDWQLMNEMVDDGGWFVETDCTAHAPVGGESDMVVEGGGAVLIRNTEVNEARYRWVTIREIEPPQ